MRLRRYFLHGERMRARAQTLLLYDNDPGEPIMGSRALNRAERDLLERMQFIPCVQSIHECSAVTARSQQSLISQQSFEKVSHDVYPVHVVSSKLPSLNARWKARKLNTLLVPANVFSTRMRMRDMTALKVRLRLERNPLETTQKLLHLWCRRQRWKRRLLKSAARRRGASAARRRGASAARM